MLAIYLLRPDLDLLFVGFMAMGAGIAIYSGIRWSAARFRARESGR